MQQKVSLPRLAGSSARRQTALVLISGGVNYYYDDVGRRVAEGLTNLGFQVDVRTLRQYKDAEYDWVFTIPIVEVFYTYGPQETALNRMTQVLRRANHSVHVMLECVYTHWFKSAWTLFNQLKMDTMLDLGLHDQSIGLTNDRAFMRAGYHFMLNGLTQRERQLGQRWLAEVVDRPIPWAFIGHSEPVRARFARYLVENLASNGLIYMPQLTHITEDGPHLNGQQMQQILEKTEFFIWRTHHDYFYMESERFRNALYAGTVPIKVMDTSLIDEQEEQIVPFRNLMIEEDDLAATLHTMPYEATRQAFIREFMTLPSFETGLQTLIAERAGVHV